MDGGNYLGSPVLAYVRALLGWRMTALRAAWRDGDRGASAVELAVITAIILAIAVGLLAIIRQFVTTEQSKIKAPGG